MEMTDGDRKICAIAELLPLEEFVEGDQARVLFMWVLSRLVHGMTQIDLDIARNLGESRKATAELQVWIDAIRPKPVHAWERSDAQRN